MSEFVLGAISDLSNLPSSKLRLAGLKVNHVELSPGVTNFNQKLLKKTFVVQSQNLFTNTK